MDCEKFDLVFMDLVYGELESIPRATALRHTQQCQRCGKLLKELSATREAARLPLLELPPGLEQRIISTERLVQHSLPIGARISRALTITAGYAMRPQIGMAALLLLMIGLSLLLLRPRSGTHSLVHVTELGVPATEQELIVSAPPNSADTPTPPAATAVATSEVAKAPAPLPEKRTASIQPEASATALPDPAELGDDRAYDAAMSRFRRGDYAGAQLAFDVLAKKGQHNRAAAELYAALATERTSGCADAVPRFDSVAASNGSNGLGHQAIWHSASCRTRLGQQRRALLDFQKLLKVPTYSQRASDALNNLAHLSAKPVLLQPARNQQVNQASQETDPAKTTSSSAVKRAKGTAKKAIAKKAIAKKKAKKLRRSKSKKRKAVKPKPRPRQH